MKTRTSTKVAVSAAIVMGWTWLTALQCGDVTGPYPPSVQGCSVIYDPNFPLGATLSRNKPANCPLRLGGTTRIPYAATAEFPVGSGVTSGFYEFDSRSWNGYSAGFFGNAVWSQGNDRYFANITGDYYAGSGGFDQNNQGWDDIINKFSRVGYGWVSATSRITYDFGFPSNTINAPGLVEPGQQYSMSATTNHPLLVSPVTWSWYVDGSHVGTTAEPEFTWQAGAPWTEQLVEAVATDGNGYSASGQTMVRASSGCGTQIEC